VRNIKSYTEVRMYFQSLLTSALLELSAGLKAHHLSLVLMVQWIPNRSGRVGLQHAIPLLEIEPRSLGSESLSSTLNRLLKFTYLHNQWSKVLPEKLKRPKLLKKFPAFYGTRRFITVFTRARHLSLS
jgi:hypothetical protein